LCDTYAAIIYGSIIGMVKDATIAEDLLKQTFQKISKNIDEFAFSKLSFLTWIMQFARAVSIDYLCVTKQLALSITDIVQPAIPGDVELLLIPLVDTSDESINIFNMILAGCQANEIAQKLNITVEAVKIGIRMGMKLKANCT